MRFRLLGPLEVLAEDEWQTIGARKWRSLLVPLLLNPGRTVSVDTLTDAIWGDEPPAKTANLVSIYVLRLRRLLGDPEGRLLVTRAPGYFIRAEPDDVDAARFERMAAEGRRLLAADPERAAAILGEALDLWHGEALADIPPSPYIEAEAERLSELRLATAGLRIEAELECGRYAQVVPELRGMLSANPLRERLWLLLMQALDGDGRRAEALEAYAQARGAIVDQLGVDPGAELRRLHQELLESDTPAALEPRSRSILVIRPEPEEEVAASPAEPVPPVVLGYDRPVVGSIAVRTVPGSVVARHDTWLPMPSPAQLPTDIGDFTGRAELVDHICEMLAAREGGSPGAVPVVVVAGSGGLGKTSLAIHVAHRLRDQYPDGQLYVDLLGPTPRPQAPVDVLGRLLRDLGVESIQVPANVEERAALYRTRLNGRRVLVLLDNAWDATQVRPLLPASSACAVIVTARSRMAGLASIHLVGLDVLDDDEALSLFTRIVGEKRTAAEPEAAAEVLLACAGQPLAIRICAARLAARARWSISTMAERLREVSRRLDELKTGDLAVRASFQVSFASLPTVAEASDIDAARAFCLLGLWQEADISLQAAVALLGQPEDQTVETLEILVDACLLECPAPDRYRLHDLLRVYAAERAGQDLSSAEQTAAVGRLRDWYNRERADPAVGPPLIQASHCRGIEPSAWTTGAGRPSAPPAPSSTQTEPGVTLASSPSARDPGSDFTGVRLPDGEQSAEEQELSPAVNPQGDKVALGGYPAADEAFLTALRALMIAHGIVGREQAAACFATLLQSWPETEIRAPGTPGETSGEIGERLTPAPAATIPDAEGYELLPDPLTATTAADFVGTLAQFRQWAGNPSFRDMAQQSGHTVASATICTALRSDKLPSLRVVLAIVAACGGDEEQKRAYTTAWRKLGMPQDADRHRGRQSGKRKLYPVPGTARSIS